MNRTPLLMVAAVIAIAACQEATTPGTEADLSVRMALRSNPPPPPIDTGASYSFAPAASASNTLGSPLYRFGSLSATSEVTMRNASAACLDNVNNGVIPVTHFFNKTNLTGWDHFPDDCDNGVEGKGSVKYQKGVITGQGTLTINTATGLLVIDLSSVNSAASSMGPCEQFIGDFAPAAVAPADTGCFTLYFDSATLDGVPGSAQLFTSCYESCSEVLAMSEPRKFVGAKRLFG